MQQVELSKPARIEAEGHSSKGNQPKWENNGLWYKADYLGYEGLAEVLISRLLERSNVQDFVRYDPVQIQYESNSVAGCRSRNFRGPDEILIPIERLYRAYYGRGLAQSVARMEPGEKIRHTVQFLESITGLKNIGEWLTMMLELDCVFLNEDRHTNNIAVIRNEKTGVYRLCPFYDNGLSLLSDVNDYPFEKDIYQLISKVEAKPFDRSFDVQVEAAEALYRPQLRLSFSEKYLLQELAKLEEYYSDFVLKRVESILLEQMRKYPYLFRT